MKPDFLLIGAAKAGTSSLRDALARHPAIFMVETPKEPAFFAKEDVWTKGADWYQDLFRQADGHQILGEGSPQYTSAAVYPHAADRIAENLPEAKLIYIVRDPLERAESHWMQLLAFQRPTARSDREALERYPQILDSSLYARQLDRYRRNFPPDQIHIVFLESLKANPEEELAKCFRFLGVQDEVAIAGLHQPSNPSVGRKTVDSPLLIRIRANPAFGFAKAAFPERLRIWLKLLFFRRKLKERIQFEGQTREYVVQKVSDDARRFLLSQGKPPGFWPSVCNEVSGEREQ